ncbi:hypothetical protein ACLOJK_040711 [Asimina triloba]
MVLHHHHGSCHRRASQATIGKTFPAPDPIAVDDAHEATHDGEDDDNLLNSETHQRGAPRREIRDLHLVVGVEIIQNSRDQDGDLSFVASEINAAPSSCRLFQTKPEASFVAIVVVASRRLDRMIQATHLTDDASSCGPPLTAATLNAANAYQRPPSPDDACIATLSTRSPLPLTIHPLPPPSTIRLLPPPAPFAQVAPSRRQQRWHVGVGVGMALSQQPTSTTDRGSIDEAVIATVPP